jgi:hypothetical protein
MGLLADANMAEGRDLRGRRRNDNTPQAPEGPSNTTRLPSNSSTISIKTGMVMARMITEMDTIMVTIKGTEDNTRIGATEGEDLRINNISRTTTTLVRMGPEGEGDRCQEEEAAP